MTDPNYSPDVEAMVRKIKDAVTYGRRCCPNCDHWVDKMEECEIAMRRPPATVIAFGCEKFEENIPF